VSAINCYRVIARRHMSADAAEWFDDAIAAIRAPLDRAWFGLTYAAAGRRLGDAPVAVLPAERAGLAGAGFAVPDGWAAADLGRVVLLADAVAVLPADEQPAFVDRTYRRGAGRERHAVLAALPLLPAPERFVATAVEACRTNVRSEFEAIACDNPYPARYFAEPQFNQLVVKALFVGAPLARVVGLATRVGAELRRMVDAFARERVAAGRPVPADVLLVTGETGAPA
jgi:hypothetical protein